MRGFEVRGVVFEVSGLDYRFRSFEVRGFEFRVLRFGVSEVPDFPYGISRAGAGVRGFAVQDFLGSGFPVRVFEVRDFGFGVSMFGVFEVRG